MLFSSNTEKQPHPNPWDERIIPAGRTSGALQPKPLLKQGHLWCWTKLLRALWSHVLKSSRDVDCTTSLSNLFWWVFLIFSLNFSCFNLCPLPLLLLPCFNVKSLAPSSWQLPQGIGNLLPCSPKPVSSSGWMTPPAFPPRVSVPAPDHPGGFLLDWLQFIEVLYWVHKTGPQICSNDC